MADIKDRAREYIAEHYEYSEVFGETFAVADTLTAMVEFAEQETKELEKENAELKSGCGICYQKDKEQLTKAKELIEKLLNTFASNDFFEEEELDAMAEAEQFLNSEEK